MRVHDARDAQLLVFTLKEGLLSKVAHDLELRAQRLEVKIDGEASVQLCVQVRGLRVVHAMLNGKAAPSLLSSRDKSKIEDTLCSPDVLHAQAHPRIELSSTSVTPRGDGYRVQADLTIRGETRPVTAEVARVGDRLETEVRLDQRDFGITPYSALLGTLKVQPVVRVRLSVPA